MRDSDCKKNTGDGGEVDQNTRGGGCVIVSQENRVSHPLHGQGGRGEQGERVESRAEIKIFYR